MVSRFGLPHPTDLSNVFAQLKNADRNVDAILASDDISQILESESFLQKQVTDLSNKANEYLVLEKSELLSKLENCRQEKENLESELKNSTRLTDKLTDQLCKAKMDLSDKIEEKESHGAKVFVAETELQVAQLRIKETEEVCQKRKDKIRKQTISEFIEQLRAREQEFTALQMQNDKLLVSIGREQLKKTTHRAFQAALQRPPQ